MRAQEDAENRVEQLWARVNQYRRRYGATTTSAEFTVLDKAIVAREKAIDRLRTVIDELEAEIGELDGEITALFKGYQVVLTQTLEILEAEYPEAWSPSLVIGFRLWRIDRGAVRGYWTVWDEPEFLARCARGAPDEVPHTDGRCGMPPCGVYAAKDPRQLDFRFGESASGWALGRVGMSGKVVEHDRGYRAAVATVLSLGAVYDGLVLTMSDPPTTKRFFREPELAILRDGHQPEHADAVSHIIEYVTRGGPRWTSESHGG